MKTLTSRQRLQTVLRGEIPDCVPVAPDFSNMIPARLTGRPFWDLYLYNDPPIWEAYVAAAKHFNIDSMMDGYFPLVFPEEVVDEGWETFIILRNDERIITQRSRRESGRRVWQPLVNVYYVADPPTEGIAPSRIGLPDVPEKWEPLEGVKPVDLGPSGLARLKAMLGDQGLIGVWAAKTAVLSSAESIFEYYQNPDKHEQWADELLKAAELRFSRIMAMPVLPDFICVGGSGTLVFQTVEIFRQLAYPAVRRVIELATAAGLPTHVHSCGPEAQLVELLADETTLTVIDPLEIPPMGNCVLADLKKRFGDKIVLKGNLHTTEVMLRGSVADVVRESKKAIDDAAEGGRFILSTGDQCGRDTPDENLRAMVETARTYGAY